MKKSLIALAVAGAMTVPAIAAADATLYGSFRMSMDKTKEESANLKDYGSRVGIKGTVDLGLEDTKGIFLWEQALNLNNGALGNGRYAYVGAKGSWGTAVGGKLDHATWNYVGAITEFQASGKFGGLDVGYVPGAGFTGNRADRRVGNSLAYVSPTVAGFEAFVGGVFAGDALSAAGTPEKDKTIDGYQLGGKYTWEDLVLGAAYGAIKSGKSNAVLGDYAIDQNLWGLSARYKLEGLSLAAKYEQAKNKVTSVKDKGYGLYAGYEVNGLGASLGYSTTKLDNADRKKATQVEVYNKMGNGVVSAGYIDYNNAAALAGGTSAASNDTFYVGYRLNF
ncbi:porin [Nitrincola tapanii]|nr:porin [Nitrincola tapanii]